MTVLFMDSMRAYPSVSGTFWSMTQYYSILSVATNLDFVTGRYAPRYIRQTSNSLRSFNRQLTAVYDELFFGLDFQLGKLPSSDEALCRPMRGGTSNPQITFAVTPLGAIRAYRGAIGSGTIIGTSATGMVNAGFLAHFEFHVKVHATDGEVTVWRNGTQILAITNENTQGQASTGIDYIAWVLSGGFYDSGADSKFGANFIATTRKGVCRVMAIDPQSDDSVTWTPTSGSDNFAMINSTLIDETTEVATATQHNIDVYNMTDLDVMPASVYAVQWRVVSRRSASGTRIQPCIRVGSDQVLGSSINTGSTGFRFASEIFNTQPNNDPWDAAAVNAMRMGFNKPVTAGTTGVCHLIGEVLASLALEPGAPLVPGAPTGRRILQVIS